MIRVVRTPGGRRRIPESEILRIQGEEKNEGMVIGYARVSSFSQKDDLERQIALIKNKGVKDILILKKEILSHYSDGDIKCTCCGERILAFLTIDHVNGNGTKHRKEIGKSGGGDFYLWLKKNNYPEGYQVLCFNCNMGRYFNGGVCPHVQQKEVERDR